MNVFMTISCGGGWVGLRGVKLDAVAVRLHGPALSRVCFVSDPLVIPTKPLIGMDKH
jgi:hypothetical protein